MPPAPVPFPWIADERQRLSRFVAGKVRDHALREDVVQETLARLVAYVREHKVDNIAALARRIALNLISDHFRAARLRPTEAIDDTLACDNPLPEQVLMHKQRLEAFTDALKDMPPLRREVLIRRRLHGESCDDIARSLNLSADAVEKHIHRGLRQLHETLARAEQKRKRYDA
ncbi:RNA polymerase sigma factor [Asticcacaulis sp. AND118]|uniref:RNA polymerase sigma factor n=1 Tax=Asticcacaulis sp. AND118 TaxID=2840468 RepID=UPI001CFF80E5|nr:RNA polymerase sigma factor [Asticcacaulis sp. AND118]UDF05001.1 RNA polymerase sigma factor [Asticcacaulis sp. AND118]